MKPDRILLKEGTFVQLHASRGQPMVHLLLFSDLLAEIEEHKTSVGVKFARRHQDSTIALLPKDVELNIKNVIQLDPSRVAVTDHQKGGKNKHGFKVSQTTASQHHQQEATAIVAWAKSEAEKAEWIKLITQQMKLQGQ